MRNSLPGIVITGASGFIGRYFVEQNANRYRMFCLARRSQQESGIPKHENIRWTQVDIGDFSNLQNVGNLKAIISDLEDAFFDSLEHDLSKDLEFIHEQIRQRD